MSRERFIKTVSERYILPKRRGGGLIKIEVWENKEGELVKYSFAYINHQISSKDNGRVIGYDNAHHSHHKHILGEIYPVENFTTYEDLLNRFEEELKEFIK
ncbi:MAG: transcriptional regulator [Anaerolinea sp. 4484_236]|nr:MAG: transcriptional regulator [Anaerolinea sp. 4484_236]